MFSAPPPRTRADLIRTPLLVPMAVMFSTVTFRIPPEVSLPRVNMP